jgi:GNAT superfamily N-acetyltransferase
MSSSAGLSTLGSSSMAERPIDNVLITIAAPQDLDDIVELCQEYCIADGHAIDLTLIRNGARGLIEDSSNGFMLIARESSGVAVGYAAVSTGWSIEVGGRDFVLDEIYARRRGVGIGASLLRAVEHECERQDVRRIFLETERPNNRARTLYARYGFTEDDSIWMSKEL